MKIKRKGERASPRGRKSHHPAASEREARHNGSKKFDLEGIAALSGAAILFEVQLPRQKGPQFAALLSAFLFSLVDGIGLQELG